MFHFGFSKRNCKSIPMGLKTEYIHREDSREMPPCLILISKRGILAGEEIEGMHRFKFVPIDIGYRSLCSQLILFEALTPEVAAPNTTLKPRSLNEDAN